MADLIITRPEGLYCESGQFYIDPWRPVEKAVITHGHSDHAKWGSKQYFCSADSHEILKLRIGKESNITSFPYGKKIKMGDVWVSFHPAGHILGSAQVRVERGSEVWVVSGDYKRAEDTSCAPFEVQKCDVFITESTFGLPIYKWDPSSEIASEITTWWDSNAAQGSPSLLLCYALGKAQRVLHMLADVEDKPIYVHGAMLPFISVYEKAGIKLAKTTPVSETSKGHSFANALILAPGSAYNTPWLRRFPNLRVANASGWMAVRGNRRRGNYDKGVVLSDHADWPALLQTIKETEAKRIIVTHGFTETLSHYLNEIGITAEPLKMEEFVPDEEN